MLVRHLIRLSDKDTRNMIVELQYMQNLCDLGGGSYQSIFDPTLFTGLYKRITSDSLNKTMVSPMSHGQEMKVKVCQKTEYYGKGGREATSPSVPTLAVDTAVFTVNKDREHRERLRIDAKCLKIELCCPRDQDLLQAACQVRESAPKPRTASLDDKDCGRSERNQMLVGTGKRVHLVDNIKTKFYETARYRTETCNFAKNVIKFFGRSGIYLMKSLKY